MAAFPRRLGIHVSIAGGIEKSVDRALQLGCSAMQIFSRNPRGWKAPPLDSSRARLFREKAAGGEIDPVVVHTPYLLNLASAGKDLHRKSVEGLAQDVGRAEQLGARFLVTHLGSSGERSPGSGRKRVVEALRRVLEMDFRLVLLLENSAGGGGCVGASFGEIAEILSGSGGGARVGFCFDTCHAYGAGYDFRSPEQSRRLTGEIKDTIGWERLHLIHLNDSAAPLGSHRDRHAHIGRGAIGEEGFRNLLHQRGLAGVPLILETPKERPGDDRENLSRVRDFLSPAERRGRPAGSGSPPGRGRGSRHG